MVQAPEVGVVFPLKRMVSSDDVLEFGPRVEQAGFDFVVSYDHVLHVSRERPDSYDNSLTDCEFEFYDNIFDSTILLGALAARTSRIKLMSGCIPSPMRQTALLARQASDIDFLSGGRLTLGLSIGWDETEFNAMGAEFHGKPDKLENQVDIIKRLTRGEILDESIGDESFERVFIARAPHRELPIFLGGLAAGAVERAARIGDGWIPLGKLDGKMEERIAQYKSEIESSGSADHHAIVGRVDPFRSHVEDCVEEAEGWRELGATHIAIGGSDSDLHHPTTKDSYYSVISKTKKEIQNSFDRPKLFV